MLKLILQTQEGQQVEVVTRPEDTFADLKKRYENPDNSTPPEFLKSLITNGTDVGEDTKILDYITNCTSLEWIVEETVEDVDNLNSVNTWDTMIIEASLKECCAKGCLNTELTSPEKVFFPLPTDRERLSTWLSGIARLELFNAILLAGPDVQQAYFVCSDHFEEHHFLKGTDQALKRRACPSLTNAEQSSATSILKPQIIYVKKEEEVESEHLIAEENIVRSEIAENDVLQLLDTLEDKDEHPGVLCRLCGEQAEDPVYLYGNTEKENEYSVADKINLYLPITVTVKDPLPKQLCQSCYKDLNACHKLALACLRTEDKLRGMLEAQRFQLEDSDEQHCPLCVRGNVRAIRKSGIYRKEKLEREPDFAEGTKSSEKAEKLEETVDRVEDSHLRITATDRTLRDAFKLDSTAPADLENFLAQSMSKSEAFSIEPLLPKGKLCCSLCQSELNASDIASHADTHPGYPCVICKDVEFSTAVDRRIHFLAHGWDAFFCELCAAKFSDIRAALDHVKACESRLWDERRHEKFSDASNPRHIAEEEGERFECEQCGKKCLKKLALNLHLKTHEKRDPAPYNCFSCSKQFTRKGCLLKHISAIHGDPGSTTRPKCYKCKKCNEAFACSASAEAHITEKHLGQLTVFDVNRMGDQLSAEELALTRVYKCEYCDRCYTTPSALHEHKQSEHPPNFGYRCVDCNCTFQAYRSLAHHNVQHARSDVFEEAGVRQYYVCKYCNKTFLHYATLSGHAKQHKRPTPYLCRLCNLPFATYKEVEAHRQTTHPYQSKLHERSEPEYRCQYCEKGFAHELALIKHIRMHTGERPHKCTVCGKGFSQTSGLYTHLKVHSDLRPYACPQCPQTFKIKGDRDNHAKKHSGDRPYKCDFCKKAFMTQHVYSQHRKIHTNERPYKCDVCGEAFRRSHVLTVHMRRHTGEKPHACDLCPKAYRQRGDLMKHMRIQHGVGHGGIASSAGSALRGESDSSQQLTT